VKKLIFAILLGFISLNSFANNIVVGNGSGTVSVTSMTGINPNDVLIIQAGTYSSITLQNINNVTIVNQGGQVTCTGPVNIGPWSYVNLMGNGTSGLQYGFNFTYNGNVFQIGSGHIADHSSIQYFQTVNSGDLIDFSGSQGGTWNLSDSSTLMFNQFTLANFSMSNSAHILYGTWDATTTLHSSSFGLQIYNAQIQNMTTGDGLIFGYNMWNYNFHDWTIGGTNSSATDDIGMIRVGGYGSVSSIIMQGSLWGYVGRLESISLNGKGTTYVYNNLKLNTTCYGVVDIRASSSNIGGSVTSANAYICNNTQFGNLDPLTYTTAAAVIFGHAGATYYVYNNLNVGSQDMGNDVYNAASDPVVFSNNLTNASATGILDPSTGKLVAGSPAINAGVALSWRTQDLYHNPATLDLGAISYGGSTPPPPPPAVNDTTLATLVGVNDSTGRIKFTWAATKEGNDSLWVMDSSSNNSTWVRYQTVATKATKGTSTSTINYGPYYFFFTPTTATVAIAGFGLLILGISFKRRNKLFLILPIILMIGLFSCTKDNSLASNADSTVVDAARINKTTSPHYHYFRLSVIHKDKTITYFNTVKVTLTF
jgi:hypothetical protein